MIDIIKNDGKIIKFQWEEFVYYIRFIGYNPRGLRLWTFGCVLDLDGSEIEGYEETGTLYELGQKNNHMKMELGWATLQLQIKESEILTPREAPSLTGEEIIIGQTQNQTTCQRK
jgi:hypothetical protein